MNVTPTLAGGKVVEYFIHFHRTRNYQIFIFQQKLFSSCRNNLFNTKVRLLSSRAGTSQESRVAFNLDLKLGIELMAE